MTPEQETQRGAEAFRAGEVEAASVADQSWVLGSGRRYTSWVCGWRRRRSQGATVRSRCTTCPSTSSRYTPDDGGRADAQDLAAELAELETSTRRAGPRSSPGARGAAQASRWAVMELEAERLRRRWRLSQTLPRSARRIASACADADDWAPAARMVRGRVAVIDERMSRRDEEEAFRELAVLRAELAAAVAERGGGVCPVRPAAARRCPRHPRGGRGVPPPARQEEEAAGRQHGAAGAGGHRSGGGRVGEPLPDVPATGQHSASRMPGDAMGGAGLALVRASWRAREGNAAAIGAVQLAEAFGSLPSPEEQAAESAALPAAARPAACAAAGPAVDQAGRVLGRRRANPGPRVPAAIPAAPAGRLLGWKSSVRRRVVRAGLPRLMRSRPWLLDPVSLSVPWRAARLRRICRRRPPEARVGGTRRGRSARSQLSRYRRSS